MIIISSLSLILDIKTQPFNYLSPCRAAYFPRQNPSMVSAKPGQHCPFPFSQMAHFFQEEKSPLKAFRCTSSCLACWSHGNTGHWLWWESNRIVPAQRRLTTLWTEGHTALILEQGARVGRRGGVLGGGQQCAPSFLRPPPLGHPSTHLLQVIIHPLPKAKFQQSHHTPVWTVQMWFKKKSISWANAIYMWINAHT